MKYTGFEDSAKVKSQLGISTKSIMHHWKEAGTSSGGIPGYAENYSRVAKYAKWAKRAGNIGIALDGLSSVATITDACTNGREGECGETVFTESGRFIGSTYGGFGGSAAGYGACNIVFGVESMGTSLLWCGLVAVGIGGSAGGTIGGAIGKGAGRIIYRAYSSVKATLSGD